MLTSCLPSSVNNKYHPEDIFKESCNVNSANIQISEAPAHKMLNSLKTEWEVFFFGFVLLFCPLPNY